MTDENTTTATDEDDAPARRRGVVLALLAGLAVLVLAGAAFATYSLLSPQRSRISAQAKTPPPRGMARDTLANRRSRGATGSPGMGMPAPGSQAQQPRPVSEPTTLSPVRRFPPRTVALLDASHAETGAEFDIEFTPYGLGPGGVQQRSVVIAVTSSKPQAGMRVVFDFKGKNVIADTSALPPAKSVTSGGRYRGRLRLSARGELLAPVLLSAERIK